LGPIIAIIALHSTLYNGWRHVYFIYPAFILIAINGLDFLIQKLKAPIARFVLFAVLVISCLSTSLWMVVNHPLQNIYFNSFTKNWDERFEVDYWGLSNKQALEKILYQWPGGWQLPYIQNLKILKTKDLERIETTNSDKDAEYIIISKQGRQETNTNAFKSKHQYELIDEVLVDNTPVLSIFKFNPNIPLPPVKPGSKVFFSLHNQGLEYLERGWQEPENWGIWSSGTNSRIKFPLTDIKPKSIELSMRALVNPKLPTQHVEIWVNGKLSKVVEINQPFGNKIRIDLEQLSKAIDLQFKLPNAAKPIDLGINQDVRQIAIGLELVEFR
jgi:hypothetical protein